MPPFAHGKANRRLAGWWLSEKLDGTRIFWTGTAYLTRNGHRLTPPPWWFVGMPNTRLDGELWMGRGTFETLVSVIQTKGSAWEGITFEVFDLAELRRPIEARIAALAKLALPDHCRLVPHSVCTGAGDLDATEAAIVAAGGEGLCLRPPGSFYRPNNFLKVKRIHRDLDRSILD